jgi:2,3-bisphosphoglycerate-dependent phosphoglycerate mutase
VTTHLYMIRHGEALSGMVDGKHTELGLSPEGIAQAEKLRDRLARTGEIGPDVLISGSAQRAQETAALIAPALRRGFTIDDGVDEWQADDGTMSEEDFMALWQRTPDTQKPFFRFSEDYETLAEFTVRAHAALHRILTAHEGKTIVVVTHGGVIHASFAYFFGYGISTLPPTGVDTRKPSITHWYKMAERPRWVLERFNDYAHLTAG